MPLLKRRWSLQLSVVSVETLPCFYCYPVAFTSYLEDVEVKLEEKHELLVPIIAFFKKNERE